MCCQQGFHAAELQALLAENDAANVIIAVQFGIGCCCQLVWKNDLTALVPCEEIIETVKAGEGERDMMDPIPLKGGKKKS